MEATDGNGLRRDRVSRNGDKMGEKDFSKKLKRRTRFKKDKKERMKKVKERREREKGRK